MSFTNSVIGIPINTRGTTTLQRPAPQTSGLVNLPPDVFLKILGMLPIQHFGVLNQTCRQFCFITTVEPLTILLSDYFPNFQNKDPHQTDLQALKEQHFNNSNPTKGVYASHTLQGHDRAVRGLALDGQRLFSGSYDKTIKIWDLNNNRCTATLEGHDRAVTCIALDGQRLFSGSLDQTIKIWDLNTNTCTATLEGHSGHVYSLLLDGQRLFSGSHDKTIKIWDLNANTCTATLEGHDDHVWSLAQDKHKLFSCSSDETIKIWDLNSNTCTATLKGHLGFVVSLALDGQRLFSGSSDHTIKIWNLNTNTCTATLEGHIGHVHSIAMVGKRLFSGSSDHTIKIWDFNAPDEAVFHEIAASLTSNTPAIVKDAMDRFDRMPTKAKNAIYGELYSIMAPFANDYPGCAKDAFHNQNGQSSTPEQRAEAIFNYLVKRSVTQD